MSIAKVKTKANIIIATPDSGAPDTQKSGAPLAGKFIFSCTDPVSGKKLSTAELAYNLHVIWINEEVVRAIPFLADKIEIWH